MGIGAGFGAAESAYDQWRNGGIGSICPATVFCEAAVGAFAGSYGSAVGMTAESMKASFKAGLIASSSYSLASSPTNLIPC